VGFEKISNEIIKAVEHGVVKGITWNGASNSAV
jgi:hypothetical protein